MMSSALDQPVLAARGISKGFPGVKALEGVSFDLRPGEVHALVGENGAGKSTLIGLLSGAMKPDDGELLLRGESVQFDSPSSARSSGIVTIFQELAIVPWLSVAANVVLGNEPGHGPGRQLLSPKRAEEAARRALRRLGADDIPLNVPAVQLSTGQKQLVEIARALEVSPDVIIMDEPTSSLPSREAVRLLEIIRQLRDEGTAIVFVSHRLDEIRTVADRVTVLREGRVVKTAPIAELDSNRIIELMTGRSIGNLFPERADRVGDVALRVESLGRDGVFDDVSFEVRSGEIIGFAGLIGAGRSEVMRVIFGADKADRGTVTLFGQALSVKSPRDALAAGIAYIPEDRKEQGLVLNLSARDNMVMSTLRRFTRFGLVNRKQIHEVTAKMVSRLSIRGRLEGAVANLSGGNQQKVVIAKALVSQARVLIFDEPTRGVDVGAKYEVYSLMQGLAQQGAAIILVSSELPEVMNLAHRAVVMSAGRVYGRYDWPDFDEKKILSDAFAAFAS